MFEEEIKWIQQPQNGGMPCSHPSGHTPLGSCGGSVDGPVWYALNKILGAVRLTPTPPTQTSVPPERHLCRTHSRAMAPHTHPSDHLNRQSLPHVLQPSKPSRPLPPTTVPHAVLQMLSRTVLSSCQTRLDGLLRQVSFPHPCLELPEHVCRVCRVCRVRQVPCAVHHCLSPVHRIGGTASLKRIFGGFLTHLLVAFLWRSPP